MTFTVTAAQIAQLTPKAAGPDALAAAIAHALFYRTVVL
jgi:hypothetical protein